MWLYIIHFRNLCHFFTLETELLLFALKALCHNRVSFYLKKWQPVSPQRKAMNTADALFFCSLFKIFSRYWNPISFWNLFEVTQFCILGFLMKHLVVFGSCTAFFQRPTNRDVRSHFALELCAETRLMSLTHGCRVVTGNSAWPSCSIDSHSHYF